jgi:hypothetical protein
MVALALIRKSRSRHEFQWLPTVLNTGERRESMRNLPVKWVQPNRGALFGLTDVDDDRSAARDIGRLRIGLGRRADPRFGRITMSSPWRRIPKSPAGHDLSASFP